jgi:ABC-type multidrug transport system fused ATPase/permease subunit
MAWPWNRQEPTGPQLAELRSKLMTLETAMAEIVKQFRTLRAEVHEDMERAERARKAEAARSRRAAAGEGANQGRGAPSDAPVTPLPHPVAPPWGARARRLARLQARQSRALAEPQADSAEGTEERAG